MLAAFLLVAALPQAVPEIRKCFGDSVGVVLSRRGYFRWDSKGRDLVLGSAPGEWTEEYFAKDAKGKWRQVLSTAAAFGLQPVAPDFRPTSLRQSANRLFLEVPSLAFGRVSVRRFPNETKNGSYLVELRRTDDTGTVAKVVEIPRYGNVIKVAVTCTFNKPRETIEYFIDSLAFVPDGETLANGGKPDSTFSPGLRKGDNQVVGDHLFREPMICAQKGTLAAMMMPDVTVLKDNRPMPTILDLDAKNGVTDATLMSYGFCDHKLTGHVWFSHDASMIRRVPKELKLAYHLIVTARAEPFGAYREAVKHMWDWYGRTYFDKVLPQAMPFDEYAKVCYPAVFDEHYGNNKLGWFETEIDGKICGGIPAGWGFTEGWVSWQCWFNQLFSAWGLHWWGHTLGNQDWIDKSDKMLNLALAAPMYRGACPTTYQSREKKWLGCLIAPRNDCYYDLTNMAWKGIWLLRWLQFEDCPRRDEILKQCREMADCMIRFQNEDGSFPTWLTKDFKVVPILDHSAQSALPCWFLADFSKLGQREARKLITPLTPERPIGAATGTGAKPAWLAIDSTVAEKASIRATDFLVKNVVDQQRYYDFETFFSCSPKQCLQMNGVIDDNAMHDPHTLSPPQNTLCMQWTAEALNSVAKSRNDPRLRAAALKALDIMALYQNAWDISYRKTAYDFGGFGVQNSDGEYNDARQAQFGITLADFGATLDRRDYFERGIAAARASLTLINHPLHDKYGIYPHPNYPLGLEPENDCHGGSDHQAGRTGFDWGEGSGLASIAWLLDKYGSTYGRKNWTVLVDGGSKGLEYAKELMKPLTDPVFDFSDWRMDGWTVQGNFAETPTYSERMDFGIPKGEGFIGTCEDGRGNYDDSYTGTITSPEFFVTKPAMKLLVGGGDGKDVYVELIDEDGKQVYIERGHDSERMDERTWDLSTLKGIRLRIRIVDKETGGWGHINVARVRSAN